MKCYERLILPTKDRKIKKNERLYLQGKIFFSHLYKWIIILRKKYTFNSFTSQ